MAQRAGGFAGVGSSVTWPGHHFKAPPKAPPGEAVVSKHFPVLSVLDVGGPAKAPPAEVPPPKAATLGPPVPLGLFNMF